MLLGALGGLGTVQRVAGGRAAHFTGRPASRPWPLFCLRLPSLLNVALHVDRTKPQQIPDTHGREIALLGDFLDHTRADIQQVSNLFGAKKPFLCHVHHPLLGARKLVRSIAPSSPGVNKCAKILDVRKNTWYTTYVAHLAH